MIRLWLVDLLRPKLHDGQLPKRPFLLAVDINLERSVQHETSLEGPILEDVEETIAKEEVELGISPPNTELDEGI
ncbi:hypothetical protein Tco_0356322 [Tanacetum coccineum]